jgi:predicted negative regulator of RcsB-dependent stress response
MTTTVLWLAISRAVLIKNNSNKVGHLGESNTDRIDRIPMSILKMLGPKFREMVVTQKVKVLSWRHHSLTLFIALLLIVVTLMAYWGVQNHEFINYDDGVYVTENYRVQAGLTIKSVIWAFTSTHASNWHPLTWLSHMLDCQLFGLNPGNHHLTSLLLHIANALMLFLVFKRMTGSVWKSSFVAALFALHPLHVESVAWVAERKDVLSTFFWILTTWAYVYYAKRPNLNRYLLVLLSFSSGLMSKPMLVTLPFVLLLLDDWPLGRLRVGQSGCDFNSQMMHSLNFRKPQSVVSRLVLEKVPLFGLAAASSVLTFFAQQQGGAVRSLEVFPIETRISNALVSCVGYIGKMLWPYRLALSYPYPETLPIWQVAGAGLFLVSVSILVIHYGKRHPYLRVGWLWYLGTLVPVIGLVQIGSQAMADRYTYIPLMGLFIMIAWGIPDILAGWRYRRILFVISAAVLFSSFIMITRDQVRHWCNSITLFKHTLNVTANNYTAYYQLGLALSCQGRFQEAIPILSAALKLKPNHAEIYNNLGVTLAQHGKTQEAIAYFSRALRIRADYAEGHSNLGAVLLQQGKIQEAIEHFTEAVRIKPNFPVAHFFLGLAYLLIGDQNSALEEYKILMATNPDLANKLSEKMMSK